MESKEQTPEQRAQDLIKGFTTAMLTTISDDGRLRSRPMALHAVEFDGDLWFFAADDSEMVREINRDPQVSVTLANEGQGQYVAMSGRARITRDRVRMRELWDPAYETWFPRGVDDPRLVLVHVDVEDGEYWDTPPGGRVQFTEMVKAVLSGGTSGDELAEHATFRG